MDPYVGGRRIRARPPQDAPETENQRKWQSLCNDPYSMDKRPSFGLWLRVTWLDILTMLILGAVAFGVYNLPPVTTRMFPLTVIDARSGEDTGEVVYPEFAYPYRPQIIPSWLDTILAILVPFFSILVVQIRVRSFWDLNNALIGLIYALETSAAFQVMIKWLIGGLRPNFYNVCQPDPSRSSNPDFNATGLNGAGYRQYMFTTDICISQGRPLWNAMQSFPSGHSTTTSAAAVYLFLYLNAKLKVFANYHPSMWKLILLYCPVLGAALICGVLTVDESHNWYDILAGVTIGIAFAFSAYRMVYASIWDWRVNHIPLNRGSAFKWNESCEASSLVFTSRAGWREGPSNNEKESVPEPSTRNRNTDVHPSIEPDGTPDGTPGNKVAGSSGVSNHNLRPPQYPLRRSRDRDRGADMV